MKTRRLVLGLLVVITCGWLSLGPCLGANQTSAPAVTPPGPAPEVIPDWQARLELARILSYMKRYDESIAEYEQVLKEKPDLLAAKAELARVLFWSGQTDKSFKMLQPIPLEDLDDQSRQVLADLYTARKDYTQAESIYQSYLKAHPDDLQVRLKLADLLSWTKRYPESLVQYEIILKAKPDDLQVRRKYAQVLSWAGRKAEAMAELRKTLK
jgi:tetratricopeptide (TPR) repeat protein